MIKRLRLKFVAINMTLVTLLLCVILGLVYYSTAADLETDSINMLRSVALNPPRPAPGEAAEDVQLPFFAVLLGPDGGIAEAAGGYFDLTDAEALAELVSEAVGSPGDIGVVPGRALRFYRADLPGRHVIVFADISSEQATLAGLVRTCAVIGALGFLAFLALSVALSRWAVRPVEKAWREQKDFVAAASHELKTPLTVIMTSAELAAPSRQTERIQSAAGRMKALIEQLLALARAENEGEKAGGGPACLSAAVENAVMEFEPLCFESGHALTSEIAPGINVRGDAEAFTQLAEILLDNAVKYSRPGGKIDVTLRAMGPRRCALTVADEGEPIEQEELANLFKRFYRAPRHRQAQDAASRAAGESLPCRQEQPAGFGLGLAIAESICKRARGRIRCESADGWNRFTVELPRA